MKVFLFIFSIIALGKRGLTMDFKQLEAFVYVVKLKSFSKAAQRIYLTQPTISAHINSLEKELDTKLIERGTKYVYPTKPGSILYQYAVKMLNLREDAVCSVKNYNKELKGTLTICASTVPSQNILPKVIAAFREEYPHVTFNILRQDSELVVESISKGMADIGFCGTDTHNPDCVFESFIQELSLVAEQDGRIVGRILFTKLKVGQTTQLALAPLAVHPDFQRQGIGGALIEEGHRIAAQLGYDYSILLGHPTYYPRFGYQPASRFGIQSPFDVPDENYMAFDLSGRHPQMSGQVEYPPQF